MSNTTPPVPPLPEQPAEEAARAPQAAPAATPSAFPYSPAPTPTTRVCPSHSLKGEVDDIGRGFFSALFDVSFRTFITRRLASVFYIVGLIAIAIGFLVYFVSGLINGIRLLAVQRRRRRQPHRRDADPGAAASRSSRSSC